MCLTCVYDYELYWFYGNYVCIFNVLFLFFLFYYCTFFVIQCLPFVANKRVYYCDFGHNIQNESESTVEILGRFAGI